MLAQLERYVRARRRPSLFGRSANSRRCPGPCGGHGNYSAFTPFRPPLNLRASTTSVWSSNRPGTITSADRQHRTPSSSARHTLGMYPSPKISSLEARMRDLLLQWEAVCPPRRFTHKRSWRGRLRWAGRLRRCAWPEAMCKARGTLRYRLPLDWRRTMSLVRGGLIKAPNLYRLIRCRIPNRRGERRTPPGQQHLPSRPCASFPFSYSLPSAELHFP